MGNILIIIVAAVIGGLLYKHNAWYRKWIGPLDED